MSFWGKIRQMLANFMQGRNGLDNLGFAALWAGLFVSIIDMFLGTGLLSMLGTLLYFYAIFRMFSRNVYKRAEENRLYVGFVQEKKTKVGQWILRLKNSKEYKYFKCPQCKVLIRLKRGSGARQIHCPKCGHDFQQKA